MAYEDPIFFTYVKDAEAYVEAAGKGSASELQSATENLDKALLAAAIVFESLPGYERPLHLQRLLRNLTKAYVPVRKAALFCIKVEAVRVLSERSSVYPLLDNRPWTDETVSVMQNKLMAETKELFVSNRNYVALMADVFGIEPPGVNLA